MPLPPVVAVRLSPSNNSLQKMRLASSAVLQCLLMALVLVTAVSAEEELQSPQRLLADIELHTAQELYDALSRVQQLVSQGAVPLASSTPVAFVLHGPEVRTLLRENYGDYRELVNLAARLSGLGVVDIKACETWMGGNSVDPSGLHSFVDTVPYAPAEKRRLLQQDYVYF